MSDAMTIATGGLKAEAFNLERISNDLANLNTNNYKASKLQFAELMYQNIHSGNNAAFTGSSPHIGLGTTVFSSSKDFKPGALKSTANWNDIAINGDGFYQVILDDGSIAYTRSSSLQVDKDHYLMTAEGQRLSDNIQIPEDFDKVVV